MNANNTCTLPTVPSIRIGLPMKNAPHDQYILGYDEAMNRPLVMSWYTTTNRFEEMASSAIPRPTAWAVLPSVREIPSNNWQGMESAPRDRFILGYDGALRYPVVMKWNNARKRFVVEGGMGDEVPEKWMELDIAAIDLGNFSKLQVSPYILQDRDVTPLKTPPTDGQPYGYAVYGLCEDETYEWLLDVSSEKELETTVTGLLGIFPWPRRSQYESMVCSIAAGGRA